jgi:hypothetical protein
MPISDEIKKKALANAKQKTPELFDDNPKTMPVDVKPAPGVAKPVVPTAPKAWDQYQKVIDSHDGWDKAVNYSNSLHMMKAVNGRYDKLLSSKEVDPDAKEVLKTMVSSSKSAMDELVKISKGAGNSKLFEMYRDNADAADAKIATMLGESTKSNYVYDPVKKIVVDRTTFEINNPSPKKKDRDADKSTSTQANAGGGGVNPYAGFLQMKNYTHNSGQLVKNEVNPLVTTWGKNAFNLFNSDDKTAGRYDADNRKNTLNYTKDALTFISKYGTQSGDKNKDRLNKEAATNHLKQLNSLGSNEDAKIAWDSQMNYVKKLSTSGKTNQVTDMIEDMGYYGSTFLYNKHKKSLGKNEKYYEGSEKNSGNLDMIDANIQRHQDYMTDTKKDKVTARTQAMLKFSGEADAETMDVNREVGLLEGMGMAVGILDRPEEAKAKLKAGISSKQEVFNAAIGDDGKIQSYHEFIKNLGPQYKTKKGLMGDYKVQTKGDRTDKIYSQNKGFFDAKAGTLFYDDEEFNETMRPLYNNIVKSYKKEFSLLNDPKKREKDMGQGNTANSVLYHDYVDMSLDKNGRMVKTQDYKGGNVAKIFGMMQGQGGSINDTDITLISDQDINSGSFSKASKSKLDAHKDNNRVTYNNFFKGADLSQMTVEFDRNASIDNHSIYTFINQKTGKKLSMVAPASYIMKNKETFFKETRMSTPEAIFQKLGKRDLPDKDNMYKDAAIIQKDGMKYATFKYKNSDGVTKTEEIPIGDVQIEVAEKQFKEYFKRLKEIENTYSNL